MENITDDLQPILHNIAQAAAERISNPAITRWALVVQAESMTDHRSDYFVFTEDSMSLAESLGLLQVGQRLFYDECQWDEYDEG